MGTNLAAPLDNGPQMRAEVRAGAPMQDHTLAQGPEGLRPDPREVLRCLHCQLVQYRTQNNHCRRCRGDLDAVPAPAPQASAVPSPELEPGLETAEATGVPVPNVAGAIRAWRQRRGLSQRQLAERMQVPRTYVSKIENDKATPTLGSLQRMAAAMETKLASLLQPDAATTPKAGAPLLEDDFVQALLPYLPSLNPRHLGQLLDASRHLAEAR